MRPLEPPPGLFDARWGAEFHPLYMDRVGTFCHWAGSHGQTLGFQISPGLKLGKGTVTKARVYMVHGSHESM